MRGTPYIVFKWEKGTKGGTVTSGGGGEQGTAQYMLGHLRGKKDTLSDIPLILGEGVQSFNIQKRGKKGKGKTHCRRNQRGRRGTASCGEKKLLPLSQSVGENCRNIKTLVRSRGGGKRQGHGS